MGIPSYFSYIIKNYPEIIQKYKQCQQDDCLKVDNLYLDCNSIIYDIYHKLSFDELTETIALTIIKSVCAKIEYYIEIIKPKNAIMIAFDGVAPVAKLDQQRSRRYKSAYQSEVLRQIQKKAEPDPWNTAAITPGTRFMKDLSVHILKHFHESKAAAYKVAKLLVSTSEEAGEGEHKIFEYMRLHPAEHFLQNTIIYGLDADLIMLSINHLPICNQIFLFRETPHFIQSIDRDLEPNENYLLDIPLLTQRIIYYMNNDTIIEDHDDKYKKVYDYIFLSFFLGNDFMPHFPALNIRTSGMDKMLSAYRATIGSSKELLTDGKKIYWKNVRKLVQFLADQEETYLKNEYKLRDKREKFNYPTDTDENIFKKFEAVPTYEREIEKYINPFKDYWEQRYYRSLFHIHNDESGEKVKAISMNYLEGLEWTLKYYTTSCPNWKWHYKYAYPPLLKDLLKCIPVFDTIFVENVKPDPVSPMVQLCYVLPKSSLNLLPSKLQSKLLEEHEEWYKSDCHFFWAFCRYFWESHVQMNEINLKELETFLDKNKELF